MKFTHTVHLSA